MADPADIPPRVVNQRRAPRRRTLFGGKVIYGDGGQHVCDCIIRDLSETGAKIAIAKGAVIPTRVILIDRRTPIAYEAKVSWIKAPDFGLTFLKTYSLEGDVPAEFEYLKRLWKKLCVPLGGTPV